ncbi:MAG: hypothetical protein K6F68_07495 [Clostridiales bacterium]|nr:hypothetical protein [Clostridiales bacterium]
MTGNTGNIYKRLLAAALAMLTLLAVTACRKTIPSDVVIDIDSPNKTQPAAVTLGPTDAAATPAPETPEPTVEPQPGTPPAIISKSGSFKTYDGTNVMRVDDRGYEICVYLEDVAKQYAQIIESAAKALEGMSRVYDMIIPMSYGIMMPDDMRPKISYYIDMRECIEKTYSYMPSVKTVSVFDTLMMHRNEFIYFRTDHHWTARGAYYAYTQLMNRLGKTPNPLSGYREVSFDGFLGTMYKDSGNDPALLPAEVVYAYYPMSEGVKMTIHASNGKVFDYPIVCDVTNYNASAKYDVFAGEDNPLTVFTNPAVTDGSSCIVIKESFGNAMMAFICDHYSTVYEIDYRYYKGSIVEFAKEHNVNDVIFLNNFMMISSKSNVGKLALIAK